MGARGSNTPRVHEGTVKASIYPFYAVRRASNLYHVDKLASLRLWLSFERHRAWLYGRTGPSLVRRLGVGGRIARNATPTSFLCFILVVSSFLNTCIFYSHLAQRFQRYPVPGKPKSIWNNMCEKKIQVCSVHACVGDDKIESCLLISFEISNRVEVYFRIAVNS